MIWAEEESTMIASDERQTRKFMQYLLGMHKTVQKKAIRKREKMAKEAMRIADSLDLPENGGNKTGSFKNVFSAFANGILADALYHEGKYQESADAYRISLHQYEGAWQATNQKTL